MNVFKKQTYEKKLKKVKLFNQTFKSYEIHRLISL